MNARRCWHALLFALLRSVRKPTMPACHGGNLCDFAAENTRVCIYVWKAQVWLTKTFQIGKVWKNYGPLFWEECMLFCLHRRGYCCIHKLLRICKRMTLDMQTDDVGYANGWRWICKRMTLDNNKECTSRCTLRILHSKKLPKLTATVTEYLFWQHPMKEHEQPVPTSIPAWTRHDCLCTFFWRALSALLACILACMCSGTWLVWSALLWHAFSTDYKGATAMHKYIFWHMLSYQGVKKLQNFQMVWNTIAENKSPTHRRHKEYQLEYLV